MISGDDRTIILSVAKWNVVLAALGLSAAIAGEIARQAAEQECRQPMNGPDLEDARQRIE